MQQPPASNQSNDPHQTRQPEQPAAPVGTPATGATGVTGVTGAPSGPIAALPPNPGNTNTGTSTSTGTHAPLWSPPASAAPHGPTVGPDDATQSFSTGGATPPPPPPSALTPTGGASQGARGGKRLHRKTENKLFLGVCSGLADYFDIDTTLMRIIFVCASLFVGTGLVLYLVLALVMPAEEALDVDPRVAAQQTVDEAVSEVKRGVDVVANKARDLTGRNKTTTTGPQPPDSDRPTTTY